MAALEEKLPRTFLYKLLPIPKFIHLLHFLYFKYWWELELVLSVTFKARST